MVGSAAPPGSRAELLRDIRRACQAVDPTGMIRVRVIAIPSHALSTPPSAAEESTGSADETTPLIVTPESIWTIQASAIATLAAQACVADHAAKADAPTVISEDVDGSLSQPFE